MTVKDGSGTAKTKTQIMSSMTDVTADNDKMYSYSGAAMYHVIRLPGASADSLELAFAPGGVYSKAYIDAFWAPATVTAITPNTGLAAGGLAVTITGTNLTNSTGVTFGGVAGTSFSVVDDTTIHVTTPAHTAGAVNVAVADDSGTVTVTNGFTYS